MMEYYLPGVDHSKLTDEQVRTKLAHLAVIRKRERLLDMVPFKNNNPVL